MTIYGIDRNFKLTVGAYREIARLLPDGNIENLGSLMSGNDPIRMMTMIFNLAVIMSKWAEKQRRFEDRDYEKPRPLTLEELETLPMDVVLGSLKDEIIRSFIESQNTEIPLKKTEAESTEAE